MFITGDLGFGVVEQYRDELPDQFVNAGVAEQNMTGIAAGMALTGKIVFTYSIANFPTLRCLEHIRNDVCYHDADVKVVSVGGGFAYGSMGATHHATEDLGVMRLLPNMIVVAPGDPVEAKAATRAVVAQSGPCYLRLGKAGETVVHESEIEFELGKALVLREGSDATLVSTGGMLPLAMRAAEALEAGGVDLRVLSMHTLKPLDDEAILRAADETRALVTLEEHSIVGGLGQRRGGAAGGERPGEDALQAHRRTAALLPAVGSQEYLLAENGLDVDNIHDTVA